MGGSFVESPPGGARSDPDANADSSAIPSADAQTAMRLPDAAAPTIHPSIQTLRDSFDDGAAGSTWIPELRGPCFIVEENGQVRFTNAGSAASRCAYRSTNYYDLRASSVQQRVPPITEFYPAVRAFLRVEDKAGKWAQIGFVGSNEMFFEASDITPLLRSYGGPQEVWWRIGESNGSLFWETSADAKTWARKRTAVSTLDASGVRVITGEETTGPMPQAVSIGYDIVGVP